MSKQINSDFNNLEEFYDYLEYQQGVKNDDGLIIKSCTFNFEVLLDRIQARVPGLALISFSDSIFKFPVKAFASKEKLELRFELKFDSCSFLGKVDFRGIKFLRDIDFIKSVFHEDVTFSEIVFNGCFRLSGSTFQNVKLAYLTLNEKFILFTGRADRTIFKGNVYFQNVDFYEAKFWDFHFQQDLIFQDTCFYCTAFFNKSKFLGKTIFRSTDTLGISKFQKRAYFNDAEISNLLFEGLTIEKFIFFTNATIKTISIKNVYCDGVSVSLENTTIGNIEDEGTARFLKTEAMKSNNPFLVSELVAKEMTLRYESLKWKKDFFDKLIFLLNKCSTNFGEKWQKGVCFIVLTWLASFILIILLRDGFNSIIKLFDKAYLKEAINYLWQFGNLDVLGDSFGVLSIITFILGKIFIIYGVYQTITAFRKYGKR